MYISFQVSPEYTFFGGAAITSAIDDWFTYKGSTGAGVAGTSYPDVWTGIRAQIQHLKAYASTESLKNACVDDRFSYVTRGSAPYVEWLGQKENPYGKGWATATNYGYDIVNMMNVLKTY